MNNVIGYGAVVSAVVFNNSALACVKKNQKDQKGQKKEEGKKDQEKQKNHREFVGGVQTVKNLDEFVKSVFKGEDVDLGKVDDFLNGFVKVCVNDGTNICENVIKLSDKNKESHKMAKFYGELVCDFIKKVWEESKNAKEQKCRENISKLLKKETLEKLMKCFAGIFEVGSDGKAVLKEVEIGEDAKNVLKEIIPMVYEIIDGKDVEGGVPASNGKKYGFGFYLGYSKKNGFMILNGGADTGFVIWADTDDKTDVLLKNKKDMMLSYSCRINPDKLEISRENVKKLEDGDVCEFVAGFCGSGTTGEGGGALLKFDDKCYFFATKNNLKVDDASK